MESQAALQLVREGQSLVKLENSTQMQIAVQRPRDEKKILQAALQELETYRSAALTAIYTKPVGKDETGKMQTAQGLSIRAAESMANRWPNSSYGCEIIAEDADSVVLGAVFLDMEANTRHSMTRRVSKTFKRRNGQIERMVGDRLDTHIAANASKLLREVILRSLPSGLKEDYKEKALEMMRKLGPENIKRMIEAFKTIGVSAQDLEFYLDKSIDKVNADDYVNLQGVYNAIDNGEASAEEIFGQSRQRQTVSEAIAKKAEEAKKGKTDQPKAEAAPSEPAQESKQEPEESAPASETAQPTNDDKDALIAEIDRLLGELGINKGKVSIIIAKALGKFKPLEGCSSDELNKIIEEVKRGIK